MVMMCGDEKDEPAGGAQKKRIPCHRLDSVFRMKSLDNGRSWIDDSVSLRSAVVAL